MSAITTNETQVREAMIELATKMVMSESVYNATTLKLAALQSETTPIAANPEFQGEMNRIHAIYQRVIPLAIQNIQAQYTVGTAFHLRITEELHKIPLDLVAISQLMQEALGQLAPLQAEHGQNEAIMGLIACRMTVLTQENSPELIPSSQWANIENSLNKI